MKDTVLPIDYVEAIRFLKTLEGLMFEEAALRLLERYEVIKPHTTDCVCDKCMSFLGGKVIVCKKGKNGLTKADLIELKKFQAERIARKDKVKNSGQ